MHTLADARGAFTRPHTLTITQAYPELTFHTRSPSTPPARAASEHRSSPVPLGTPRRMSPRLRFRGESLVTRRKHERPRREEATRGGPLGSRRRVRAPPRAEHDESVRRTCGGRDGRCHAMSSTRRRCGSTRAMSPLGRAPIVALERHMCARFTPMLVRLRASLRRDNVALQQRSVL